MRWEFASHRLYRYLNADDGMITIIIIFFASLYCFPWLVSDSVNLICNINDVEQHSLQEVFFVFALLVSHTLTEMYLV